MPKSSFVCIVAFVIWFSPRATKGHCNFRTSTSLPRQFPPRARRHIELAIVYAEYGEAQQEWRKEVSCVGENGTPGWSYNEIHSPVLLLSRFASSRVQDWKLEKFSHENRDVVYHLCFLKHAIRNKRINDLFHSETGFYGFLINNEY